ncbi:hypothetical protein A2U01_0007930, partial [Trifolium medium]|nr:hypothetical protein [Trifolium medium]
MESNKGIIASSCKPIMQYQQGGSMTKMGGVFSTLELGIQYYWPNNPIVEHVIKNVVFRLGMLRAMLNVVVVGIAYQVIRVSIKGYSRSCSENANSLWNQIVQRVGFSVWVAAVLDSFTKVANCFSTTCSAYKMVPPKAEYLQMTPKGRHSKKWDQGDNDYFFYIKGSLQFQQWDLGGCSLVHGEGQHDLEATPEDTNITLQYCVNFNLEDKVDFKGE